MKKSVLLLLLSGCGGVGDLYFGTTPGSPLPAGIAVCNERDYVGRCKKWSTESDICINPKGPATEPPTVWCNYIKDGVLQEKPVDGNYHNGE